MEIFSVDEMTIWNVLSLSFYVPALFFIPYGLVLLTNPNLLGKLPKIFQLSTFGEGKEKSTGVFILSIASIISISHYFWEKSDLSKVQKALSEKDYIIQNIEYNSKNSDVFGPLFIDTNNEYTLQGLHSHMSWQSKIAGKMQDGQTYSVYIKDDNILKIEAIN